ncbi:hypothetical protein JNK62_04520 [bacterium]|nr:hypothetical protein [bacterium]
MASYSRVIVSAMFAAAILVYVDMPKIEAGCLETINGQLALVAFNLYALGFLIAFVTNDPMQGLAAGFFATVISLVLAYNIGVTESVIQVWRMITMAGP